MTRYLTVDQVLDFHERHGGGGPVRDLDVITSAVMRPQLGFGGHGAHPTLTEKAAALLHGLASTQGFEDGNKRTAWIAMVAFLDLNGEELPDVPVIDAEVFAMAVAVSAWSDGTVAKATEWLQQHLAVDAVGARGDDPRVEFAFIAQEAAERDGCLDVQGATLVTVTPMFLPMPLPLTLVARLNWGLEDIGTRKELSVAVHPQDGGESMLEGSVSFEVWGPVQSGHSHHISGLVPSLVIQPITPVVESPGPYVVSLALNGRLLARRPLNVVLT